MRKGWGGRRQLQQLPAKAHQQPEFSDNCAMMMPKVRVPFAQRLLCWVKRGSTGAAASTSEGITHPSQDATKCNCTSVGCAGFTMYFFSLFCLVRFILQVGGVFKPFGSHDG